MKDSTKAFFGAIIIFYLILAFVFGSFNPLTWRLSVMNTSNNQNQNNQSNVALGTFDMHSKGCNSLDIAASLVEGTDYYLYWFGKRPGGWIQLGKGDATVELTDADQGYIYAVVEVPSGVNYYVDFARTQLNNPRVASVSYEDVDNDGYKEFVFQIDMSNVPKPASGNPSIYFYPYFLAYQKPTINSPSDISSIGTAAATEYVEWYLTFANEKKAYGIIKVELSVNTTDTTKVQLSRMNIPGIGYLTGDQFGTPYKGTNSLTWTYEIGSNLYEANYITYGTNQLDKFEFTTELTCQLASGDHIQATITIYGITPAGVMETITDSVVLSA